MSSTRHWLFRIGNSWYKVRKANISMWIQNEALRIVQLQVRIMKMKLQYHFPSEYYTHLPSSVLEISLLFLLVYFYSTYRSLQCFWHLICQIRYQFRTSRPRCVPGNTFWNKIRQMLNHCVLNSKEKITTFQFFQQKAIFEIYKQNWCFPISCPNFPKVSRRVILSTRVSGSSCLSVHLWIGRMSATSGHISVNIICHSVLYEPSIDEVVTDYAHLSGILLFLAVSFHVAPTETRNNNQSPGMLNQDELDSRPEPNPQY